MIYYRISFSLTLISKYNIGKIFVVNDVYFHFHFIKTSNILENKSQVFERSDCSITVHNDLYYNELKI